MLLALAFNLVIDLICLAAYAYVVQPFIFTFSCVPVGTLGIESDVAGLELHCNDHTQAAVRNYICIYMLVLKNINIYISQKVIEHIYFNNIA